MSLAVVGISHAPLMGANDPAPEVLAAVEAAFDGARCFVQEFAPELVVVLAPDHYNGLFHDMMPQFCLATAATSVGDWLSSAGPLSVDRDAAMAIARALLAADIDLTVSERLEVDHGFAQPLDILFGGLSAVPIVPLFVNAAAPPFGPLRRARLLGTALGHAVAALGRRTLVIGSGGLSHDPPVPRLQNAAPDVAERLIAGRHPSAEARRAREAMVTRTGADFAAGTATIAPLNPEWDEAFLDRLAAGELAEIDGWDDRELMGVAGAAVQEVRTWIAAYSALASQGSYRMTSRFYRPIPEWIAGFAISTAASDPTVRTGDQPT